MEKLDPQSRLWVRGTFLQGARPWPRRSRPASEGDWIFPHACPPMPDALGRMTEDEQSGPSGRSLTVIDALQYSNWDRSLVRGTGRAGGLTAVHVTITYWEERAGRP